MYKSQGTHFTTINLKNFFDYSIKLNIETKIPIEFNKFRVWSCNTNKFNDLIAITVLGGLVLRLYILLKCSTNHGTSIYNIV